ncbi:MAG TPA: hypothetical protein VGO18_04860 [Steroidobacteraceae bacterium]|jgi:hypothetical protein|nr:hypothetical protein [Steroidobacteraceae bacterium]
MDLHKSASFVVGAVLAAVPNTGHSESAIPDRCHARLSLTLTPDVPNPRDPSFLSALSANPLYTITWVEGSDSTAVVDLTGPATDYHCTEEIKRLSRDAHILDLKVLQRETVYDHPSGH